jgi:beta-lactamase regulating signal transducer with metallopeptidase domain
MMNLSDIIPNLIKTNILIIAFYLFYRIFMYGSVYHALNRLYLLLTVPIAIILPFLKLNIGNTSTYTTQLWINEFQENIQTQLPLIDEPEKTFPWINVIFIGFYSLGILLFSIHLFLRIRRTKKLIKGAVQLKNTKNIYCLTHKNFVPFTFLNRIFIPQNFNELEGINSIISHERVHVKHLHSFDLILSEIFCVLLWYNPFVFFLNKSIKTVHEFEADASALHSGTELSMYLKLLYNNTCRSFNAGLNHSFNDSIIKKRIQMITKNKTVFHKKIGVILLVPFFLLSIVLFSNFSIQSDDVPSILPIESANIRKVSSGYGMRMHPMHKEMTMHKGVDFVAPKGTPVIATANGKVVKKNLKKQVKGMAAIL